MLQQNYLLPLAALLSTITAAPLVSKATITKPPAFILAGDSTTAVQSSGGGGWGTGFLNTTLHSGATGTNLGHDGATTVSFRAGGDWANALALAKSYSTDYTPFVTIQFGHNDQKPTANISLAEFEANLVQFAADVTALGVGATPIILTPLSRRSFNDDDPPTVVLSLANVTAAATEAAEGAGIDWVDLNLQSTLYLNSIGPTDAATYNRIPTDFTHLNAEGSIVFGGIVADLLVAEVPALSEWVTVPAALETALEAKTYYWPDVE